jgi:hypothetical protein
MKDESRLNAMTSWSFTHGSVLLGAQATYEEVANLVLYILKSQ